MKRHFWATALSIFAMLLTCLGFVACEQDEDGNNLQVDVNDLMTEAGLIEFHENGAKYPDNFVFEELSGYGRVLASTSSREEALSTAEHHFNSGWCTTVENRIEVETDLFFGLYVKWDYRSGGVGEPIAYYDEYVVSFKKSVYDATNKQFFTKDKNKIKSILDYIIYSNSYNTGGTKVYGTEIVRDGTQYVYTAYVLTVTYGDWAYRITCNY